MGIFFGRVADILKPNNSCGMQDFNGINDPEQAIRIIISEIKEAVQKTVVNVSVAIIQEKRLKKYFELHQQSENDFEQKTTQAIFANNEELARKYASEKLNKNRITSQFKGMYEQASHTANSCQQTYEKLKEKLKEAIEKKNFGNYLALLKKGKILIKVNIFECLKNVKSMFFDGVNNTLNTSINFSSIKSSKTH